MFQRAIKIMTPPLMLTALAGCLGGVPVSDTAGLDALETPINDLNLAVITGDLGQINTAARNVFATYDAARGTVQ